jgi:1-acyl-sn-glycerol-3-phosphate acyltransferase
MIKVAVRLSHPTRREVRFLVEDFVYHFPFLGMAIARFGGVRACQENAERLLAHNQLVAVFPEGVKGIGKHYKNRYQVQRFGRGGLIRLAMKTQTPIIPTAIIGAEEIYPLIARSKFLARPLGIPYIPITPLFPWFGPLGLCPLPSKWGIYFGEPIDFQKRGYGPDAANDRLLVSRLNEEVRTTIQEMIKDRLSKRLSVWFG